MKKRIGYSIVIALAAAVACKRNTNLIKVNVPTTLLEALTTNFNASIFYHGLKISHYDTLFNGREQYTVFVPDNAAFHNLTQFTVNADSDLDKMNPDSLRQFIGYHIVKGRIGFNDIPSTLHVPYISVTGQTLYFSEPQNQTPELAINGVNIPASYSPADGIRFDQPVSDGVIYQISGTDIQNGLHRPFSFPTGTVQDLLLATPRLSLFVTALKKFNLWDSLAGPGPYTVFAPTNEAFAAGYITPRLLQIQLDTLSYEKILFGIYILKGYRIFVRDFDFATTAGTGLDNNGDGRAAKLYPAEDIRFNLAGENGSFTAYLSDFLSAQRISSGVQSDVLIGNGSEARPISDDGNSSSGYETGSTDYMAFNGVVHELAEILISKDSVKIK